MTSRAPQVAAQDSVDLKVSRYMQDVAARDVMRRQSAELENLETKGRGGLDEAVALADDPERLLGVQLDQEDSVDRVYRDLTSATRTVNTDGLPNERINSRLAERRWLNEFERAQRIQIVRNFVRAAYERGFEVEIDQNLVVVGVRRITNQKLSIDQVIDRLAKQGF